MKVNVFSKTFNGSCSFEGQLMTPAVFRDHNPLTYTIFKDHHVAPAFFRDHQVT